MTNASLFLRETHFVHSAGESIGAVPIYSCQSDGNATADVGYESKHDTTHVKLIVSLRNSKSKRITGMSILVDFSTALCYRKRISDDSAPFR